MLRALAALLVVAAVTLPSRAGAAEIFRPCSRTAEELAPVAESILGPGGVVAVDPGTGSLILRGEPAAVAEALSTLRRLDVRPASYEVSTTLTRMLDLDRAGVSVTGWIQAGDVRIGRAGRIPDGIRIAPRGLLAQEESAFAGQVAVLEGNTAEIWTGTTYPERQTYRDARGGGIRVYETATLVPVQTGFRVRPRGRADGSIELELAPVIAERGEDGNIVRAAAATRVVVRPGETLVVASAHESGAEIAIDPFASADTREGANDSAMLVRVERSDPGEDRANPRADPPSPRAEPGRSP